MKTRPTYFLYRPAIGDTALWLFRQRQRDWDWYIWLDGRWQRDGDGNSQRGRLRLSERHSVISERTARLVFPEAFKQ